MDERDPEQERREAQRLAEDLWIWRERLTEAMGEPPDPIVGAALSSIVGEALDRGRELERGRTLAERAEVDRLRAELAEVRAAAANRDELAERLARTQRLAQRLTARVSALRHRLGLRDTQPIPIPED
jgi:hypothetical protein